MANYDVIVIGGGPAGLTAALYCARAGRKTLVLEKLNLGGQITSAPLVENYPGLPGMSGAEYGAALTAQAESFGVETAYEEVSALHPGSPIHVLTDAGEHTCRAAILAVGARHKTLGLEGEEDLVGAGISYCAVCDGAFYEDREVVVVGGGNSALQEALFLSKICKKVTLVHRRGQFRADECLVQRFHAAENISFLYPYTVSSLVEEDGEVRGVKLRHVQNGSERVEMTDGVFVAIGHEPETEPFAALGLCGEGGYFAVSESTETHIPGVFVAGDCRAKTVRQLTTACGDGAVAAMAACRYLEN